jgi:hypothetical protein
MIFEIDIWRSNAIEDDIAAWCVNAREATQENGFGAATLHRVYKQINQQGYDFVSLVGWDNSSGAIPALRLRKSGLPNKKTSAGNFYSLINQGGDLTVSDPGNLIVINPYRIDRASAARHAEMWEQSKQHMQNKEGFVNARFFEAIDAAAEYVFVSQFAGRDFREIVAPFESMFSICFSRVIARVEQSAVQQA